MTTNADDEFEHKFSSMTNDQLRLAEMLEEKRRMVEALTAVTASQHDEIVRCHERINELLKSNNWFEERARSAERKLRAIREWADSLPIGYPLMQDGRPIDHTALNNLKQGV